MKKFRFPLNEDYLFNALLIQKIEKGFGSVLKLLSCCKKNEDVNYFDARNAIEDINKGNFNLGISKSITSKRKGPYLNTSLLF